MPQARRSSGSSGSRSSSGRSTTKRSTGGAAAGKSRASASRSAGGPRAASKSRSGASRATGTSRSRKTPAGTPEAQLEAIAQRLRKLNERIIEAGREAGDTTLTSYEKVLKAIASAIERVPGSSDVEWLSNLATTQAKFIRDMTDTWTARARKAIK